MPGHPGDHTPGWQLHTRQGSAPPPRPRSRLWPLPPVPPQVPACDPRGPASLPSPRPLRRTFLKKKKKKKKDLPVPKLSPLTEPSPTPAWCGPWGQWAAVCGAKVRSVPRPCRAPWRRQPRSPNQCRWPWGTGLEVQGVDPFSPSLFLSLLPLRAQLPGKIIQATPLKRPHGRAPS